jgi:ethanolamine utilization microcompartment shell protein EutS
MLEFLGAAGAGAADALQEQIAQQLRQQMVEQQAEEARQRLALDQQRLNEQVRGNAADEAFRGRQEAAANEQRAEVKRVGELRQRGRSNMAGVVGMGLDPQTAKRELAFTALNNDVDIPGGVMDAVEPPQVERDPLADYEAKKKIDLRYREPQAPQRDPIADYEARKAIDSKYNKQPMNAPPSNTTIEHSQMVASKVDDILPRIGMTTAGPIGALLSNIGGTEASDVSADLNSLAANLAFDQLQKMREASKTGGALGAVSDRESELLQSVVASIRQNQSPANLRKNLQAIKDSATRFLRAAEQSGGLEPMRPMTSRGGAAPSGKPKFTIVGVK